ncbi:hypothetical protein HYG81_15325 [Natrinema zhouii]|uniref:Uncharacterized protein n=1 Tax=Natrinema zhouii TaxID=1710539 RepID=A0A7D6GJT3_9EURY|nr:hypothetical protein [Natrinema zhouii]QLK25440.1 hypothetical protein HYG81_15325 [Natrinema zhouii]
MNEDRIETRLNVTIGLLLIIIGYLFLGSLLPEFVLSIVQNVLSPFAVVILVPASILLLVWGLAKISVALESS